MSVQNKLARRSKRRIGIRKKISGSDQRPRLTVFRSLKHIYVQAIDDVSGRTLASASSLNDELVTKMLTDDASGRVGLSTAVGKAIAARLGERNITSVTFDRNGYLYHGRVRAVAEGAREGGLQF